jgi:putative flippase GtrA
MESYRQFIRFLIVGALGFVVDVGVLYLALHVGFGYFSGRAISFLCAVLVTWQINRQFTFTKRSKIPVLNEALRYLAAMALGGFVNYAAYTATVLMARDIPLLPLLAVAIGSIAGLLVNFFSAKRWVFKP